jgi:uncharacterized protein (TIGR04255 family)
MKLPKKISPDSIKDALIEVKYSSEIPFEVLVGMFFNALDDSYRYTNRPLQPQGIPGRIAGSMTVQEVTINLGVQSLFFNDRIQVKLLPNSIVFSCLKEYIGWESYKKEIETVLIQIFKSNQIQKFTRVGIRYISQYSQKELHSCIKFSFSFGIPQVKSNTYKFYSEFDLEKFKVLLNLHSLMPVLSEKDSNSAPSIVPTSVIDIDVIADNLSETTLEGIFSILDNVHSKEKEVFFNLLKEEFLLTLNPEY